MRSLSFAIIAAGPKPAKVPVSIPTKIIPKALTGFEFILANHVEEGTKRVTRR